MSSLRPMLSKSMTITSKAASLNCSTGNVYSNFSSKIGFKLHLKTTLLRFSTFLSPTCNHTFTYGSENNHTNSNQLGHNIINMKPNFKHVLILFLLLCYISVTRYFSCQRFVYFKFVKNIYVMRYFY